MNPNDVMLEKFDWSGRLIAVKSASSLWDRVHPLRIIFNPLSAIVALIYKPVNLRTQSEYLLYLLNSLNNAVFGHSSPSDFSSYIIDRLTNETNCTSVD